MTTNLTKKSSFLLLLFLAGCIPAAFPVATSTILSTLSPVVSPTKTPTIDLVLSPTVSSTRTPTIPVVLSPTVPLIAPPTLSLTEISLTEFPELSSLDSFRRLFSIDAECLHLCWLGINPGITSAKEAHALLEASDEINLVDINETYIEAFWQGDFDVFVRFEKGLVRSIDFNRLASSGSTIKDFIKFLGDPDELRITTYATYHCDHIAYLVYYSSRKTALFVEYGSWDGPNPGDFIEAMNLNIEFDDTSLKNQYLHPIGVMNNYLSDRQPWLGFGHLQEYLPGQKLPAGPCQP